MKLNNAWLYKLRLAISDPYYTGPPAEECAKRAGLDYVPKYTYEINRLIDS